MMTEKPLLCKMLDIELPIIMAPMFLVTNEKMMIAAMDSGIAPAIPALNYRSVDELREGIRRIKQASKKPFGINLIVNNSNILYKDQLNVICEEKVGFIITSLGNPKETILKAHQSGIKVFCDVTNIDFALKVEALGADAVIAVNKEAGGHAGDIPSSILIPQLVENCKIPVISAGGIGDGHGVKEMIALGASGVSMGSVFIASNESDVSKDYKEACVTYGANDIVRTTKLSGTPCTVINTPYVQKVGTNQNWFEKLLNKNKRLKKWVKAFVFFRGMKSLEKAAFSSTYKTVWCAGPSIEFVREILPISKIISNLKSQYEQGN